MIRASLPRILVTGLACALLARFGGAGVLVVGTGGFPDIQAAVNAAQDGDLILVKPGSYPGFTVTDKSLDIHADPTAQVTGPVVVDSLSAGKTVSLRGFVVDLSSGPVNPALTVSQCQGNVWLEECELTGGAPKVFGFGPGEPGLLVDQTNHLTAVRCSFTGGSPFLIMVDFGLAPKAGPGASISEAHVAFFECEALGGANGYTYDPQNCSSPTDGAAGILVTKNSSAVLENTHAKGGRGQAGSWSICWCLPSGNGGPGLLTDANLQAGAVKIRDSVLEGGEPGPPHSLCSSVGQPGPPIDGPPGTYEFLPGKSRSLRVAGPLREAQGAAIELSGLPNDAVLLFVDTQMGALAAWPFPGLFVLGFPPAVATMLPPLPPSGGASIPVTVPSLPPGLEGLALGLQAVLSDPQNTRTATLSSPSRLLVLDSGL